MLQTSIYIYIYRYYVFVFVNMKITKCGYLKIAGGLFSRLVICVTRCYQLVVNWWFGLVVWDSRGSPK